MTTLEAVLLAAGESTRMGALKALLPWAGELPLIEYQVRQLGESGVERLIVVLGHRSDEVRRHIPAGSAMLLLENPDYHSGKVSSILAGARACRTDAHLLILGVDQPRPAALVRQVVKAHLDSDTRGGQPDGARVSIAGYEGRRGHPVIFSPALREALLAIREETEGLRSILRAHADAIQVVETGDPLALVNLNTPEDYARARQLAGLDQLHFEGARREPVDE